MGRSNVGKSSFINTLVGRRNIARVSSTPGKTRTINLFLCDNKFFLVDLPGYGYSKVSQKERRLWARQIDEYVTYRRALKGVVLLVDARHFPLESDLDAIAWLDSLAKPYCLVATKADKLNKSEFDRQRNEISSICRSRGIEFVMFSARTGLGKKEVWNWLMAIVNQ